MTQPMVLVIVDYSMVRLKLMYTTAYTFHDIAILGVWYCDYSEERNDTRWQLTECRAPEDLQFAGSSVCMCIVVYAHKLNL